MVTAKTQVPRRRTGSLVSWLPSLRDPVTKSASPATTGRQHALHLGRVVLAVGVGGHDVPGAALAGQPVAQPQRRALAPVDRHVADQRAVRAALGHRAVPGAVRHHDRPWWPARTGGGQRVDDRADHPFLVVGGDHDGDRRQVRRPVAVLVRRTRSTRRRRRRWLRRCRSQRSLWRPRPSAARAAAANSGHTVASPDFRSCVGW